MLNSLLHHFQGILSHTPSQHALIDELAACPEINRYNHLAAHVAMRHKLLPSALILPDALVEAFRTCWGEELGSQARANWEPAKRAAWERIERTVEQSGVGYDALEQIALGYAVSFHLADRTRPFKGPVVDACAQLTAHTCTLFINRLREYGCTDGDIMTAFGPMVQHTMRTYRAAASEVRRHDASYSYLNSGVHDIQPMFKTLITEPEWFPSVRQGLITDPASASATEKLGAISAKTHTRWGLG